MASGLGAASTAPASGSPGLALSPQAPSAAIRAAVVSSRFMSGLLGLALGAEREAEIEGAAGQRIGQDVALGGAGEVAGGGDQADAVVVPAQHHAGSDQEPAGHHHHVR